MREHCTFIFLRFVIKLTSNTHVLCGLSFKEKNLMQACGPFFASSDCISCPVFTGNFTWWGTENSSLFTQRQTEVLQSGFGADLNHFMWSEEWKYSHPYSCLKVTSWSKTFQEKTLLFLLVHCGKDFTKFKTLNNIFFSHGLLQSSYHLSS